MKLVTERLQKQLEGEVILKCHTNRQDLYDFSQLIIGLSVKSILCKGKQIFFDFGINQFLYNHLLMRGKWKSQPGRLLFLPPDAWIAFETNHTTIINYRGQKLQVLNSEQLKAQLDSLGVDLLSENTNKSTIIKAISNDNQKPIGELLLDQSILCGVGNVAKSESLFLAQIHPVKQISDLSQEEIDILAESTLKVMWNSYHQYGKWTHRVYRRAGQKCLECGTRIVMIRQGSQKRSTYFCPRCQR